MHSKVFDQMTFVAFYIALLQLCFLLCMISGMNTAFVSAYQLQPPPEQEQHSQQSLHRRHFVGTAAMLVATFQRSPPNSFAADVGTAAGILRSKGCYQGVGDGCTEFAEENPLIQKLQQQSALNREKNEREALNAYYMKNYPDFFNSIGKVMIKKSSDNTFFIVSLQEAEQMKLSGKLTYEVPMTRGGKVVDYTQKPVLILRE
jgi:hypothetical protein